MKIQRVYFLLILILLSARSFGGELNTFHLSEVKLLDGPFLKAQKADLNYILALDPDKLLAPYLKDAGIEPLKPSYGNWENIGLDGHICGHYLSALAMMYQSTGDAELLRRLNYIVNWFDTCQQKNGDGYVGGIPESKALWNDIRSGKVDAGGFSLSNRWVPLYNIHKVYAGLRDAYVHAGNKKALGIFVKLGNWFYDLTKNLSDAQIQEILKSEHGGLNEVFTDLATITGDKKYLDLAIRVSHRAILDPLLQKENQLTGLHANTQIPKVIGFKRIADETNNAAWDSASVFFWKTVIDNWTVSIGGNSVREHFHPANDYSSMIESNQGPETCNTYNMLKLTRMLILSNPKADYFDYYERALYNHILSSEHPEKGGFVYFTPMRPNHYRVYSQPQECFWCCVGSGLENHTKYGELIYAHKDNDIFVNLFIPSELNSDTIGIGIAQQTSFPFSEKTNLTLKLKKAKEFTLNIRKPGWVKPGQMKIAVNDEEFKSYDALGIYISLKRNWKNGDIVHVQLPMQTRVEYFPDGSSWASVVHGPIVLAAATSQKDLDGLYADDSRMGHVANGPYYPINETPVVVTDSIDFSQKIEPVDASKLLFKFSGLLHPESSSDLQLKPFFDLHESRYVVYFPVSSKKELTEKMKRTERLEKEKMELESITVDQVAPGEQQPEVDHRFKGEETQAGVNANKYWRDSRKWFSYELTDKDNQARTLRITYFGLDKDRNFDVLVNDVKIATVQLNGDKGNDFYDVDYSLPANVKSKNGVLTLKFVAAKNSIAGGIYYVRLLK